MGPRCRHPVYLGGTAIGWGEVVEVVIEVRPHQRLGVDPDVTRTSGSRCPASDQAKEPVIHHDIVFDGRLPPEPGEVAPSRLMPTVTLPCTVLPINTLFGAALLSMP